jgi:hypothetical protein
VATAPRPQDAVQVGWRKANLDESVLRNEGRTNSTLFAIATARIASAFSFPFHPLRNPFLTARLIGSAHEFGSAFAGFSDQNLALRRHNFFDRPQIGKERAVDGHGKPETYPATEEIAM